MLSGHVSSHTHGVFKTRIVLRFTSGERRLHAARRAGGAAEDRENGPQRPWISEEEAARIGRPRTLLDDNPASG